MVFVRLAEPVAVAVAIFATVATAVAVLALLRGG